jgi:ribosome biogenesis GTPase / thiamine phosphate phosphatase
LKRKKDAAADNRNVPESLYAEPAREGLLIAHHGVAVEVLFADGEQRLVRIKRRSGHVVGDAVLVRGEVLERLPRRTELRRQDAAGKVHLVGANLDVLGVVISPSPLPPSGFVDRAVVAARAAQLLPFLVVNKCDLPTAEAVLALLADTYGDAIPVFPVSAVTGEGLPLLRQFLGEGHRGAFVGTTGVGKSSLLNALCPESDLRVGALNDFTGKGRHTTTVSTLHALTGGGELIDTPGFQDFGLVDISAQDFADYFPGFEKIRDVRCRFRNCRHRFEPGCAVMELVAKGELRAERYDTYLTLLSAVEKPA